MDQDAMNALLDAKARKKPKQKDKGLSEFSSDLIASGGDENVCVCVRVRPFNSREMDIQEHTVGMLRSVVEMPDGIAGKLRMLHRDEATGEYSEVETFHFSRTFWSVGEHQQPHKYLPIQQEDVFEVVGRSVVANGLGGFNVCVFAYGQTGSGKTHTMMGDVQIRDGNFVGDPGLIPRLCRELFAAADRRCKEVEAEGSRTRLTIDIKLSALEIYNEQVRDLFWRESPFANRTKTTTLKIRKHPTEGHFVDELTTLNPRDFTECVQRIASGLGERSVAATLMNDESSRSHSVFQIQVMQTETVAPDPEQPYEKPVVTTRVSRINLVDLAGSERVKKSGAQCMRLKEAAGINLSLSTLQRVIDALVQNSIEKNPTRQVLVPYRESALTQLLSHSLGGNSKTIMIACVSPHFDNQEESLLTLLCANRTKGVVNHVKSNENNTANHEKLLKDQLAAPQARVSDGPQQLNEAQRADLRDQHGALGDHRQALKYSLEALDMMRKGLPEGHPDIATSLNNIVTFYSEVGDHEQALSYALKALEMHRNVLPDPHLVIASSQVNIGKHNGAMGDAAHGLEYALEALAIQRKVLPEPHVDTAMILSSVAGNCSELDLHAQALSYALESLAMRRMLLPDPHPDIASSLSMVGVCYDALGDERRALEYSLKALVTQRQLLSENLPHPDIASSLYNVGNLYARLGDYEQALKYSIEALEVQRKVFPDLHPNIASSLSNIGACHSARGNHALALQYSFKALEMRLKVLSSPHPDIASSLCNIGACHSANGDHEQALKYSLKALEMQRKVLPDRHPDVARSLVNIGNQYAALGDPTEALKYSLEAPTMGQNVVATASPWCRSAIVVALHCVAALFLVPRLFPSLDNASAH